MTKDMTKPYIVLLVCIIAVLGLAAIACLALFNNIEPDNRATEQLRAQAEEAARENNFEQAQKLFSQAISQAGTSGDMRLKSQLLTELGDVYARQQLYREAESTYSRALSFNSDLSELDTADKIYKDRNRVVLGGKLATALFKQGKLGQAKVQYAEVLQDRTLSLTVSEKERLSREYTSLLKQLEQGNAEK